MIPSRPSRRLLSEETQYVSICGPPSRTWITLPISVLLLIVFRPASAAAQRASERPPYAIRCMRTLCAMVLVMMAGACATISNHCPLPAPLERPAPPPGERTLTVLSYNVKGLPRIFQGGHNAARYRAIANALRVYDVAALQELFVVRRALLDHLPAGFGASHESSGPWVRFYGNGLVIAAPAHHLQSGQTAHVTFGRCNGFIGGANDCFSQKGVLRTSITLVNGDTADVYTLHMDAGGGRKDRETRIHQLEEVRSFVERLSVGRPLVIMGDFNIDRSDSTEVHVLESFRESLGLTDTQTLDQIQCRERLDYIYFRGGGSTRFRLLSTGIDAVAMGSPALSDHPPIYAVLAY